MIDTHAYISEDGIVTVLHVYTTGYLITQGKLGEELVPKGFTYSCDQACQRFWELAGVELQVEEVAG